jgi:hypothetical protein
MFTDNQLYIDDLKTGDLLLFEGNGKGCNKLFDMLIKYGTSSNYTHVGIFLRNPKFIHPCLKGDFIWESSLNFTKDPQDGEVKFGVQITPLKEILHNCKKSNTKVYVRKVISDNDLFTQEKMKKIHDVVYNKPYDIIPSDWVEAYFGVDSNPKKTNRFWCSSLVGYIYSKVGLIKEYIDWSILKPSDFSIDEDYITFTDKGTLEEEEKRLLNKYRYKRIGRVFS